MGWFTHGWEYIVALRHNWPHWQLTWVTSSRISSVRELCALLLWGDNYKWSSRIKEILFFLKNVVDWSFNISSLSIDEDGQRCGNLTMQLRYTCTLSIIWSLSLCQNIPESFTTQAAFNILRSAAEGSLTWWAVFTMMHNIENLISISSSGTL